MQRLFLLLLLCFVVLGCARTHDSVKMQPEEIEAVGLTDSIGIVAHDVEAWRSFFQKLKNGAVNIVHIGDSHLQADFFSGHLRKLIHQKYGSKVSPRGFVFPYAMASTNNPTNFRVSYSGKWESSSALNKPTKGLGMSAIEVATCDSSASFGIKLLSDKMTEYKTTNVTVYSRISDTAVRPVLDYPTNAKLVAIDSCLGTYTWNFSKQTDSVSFKIITDSVHSTFCLQGLRFGLEDDKINYHTLGVNGAQVASFLKCSSFSQQLSTLLSNLIIVSLGTNDSYAPSFDSVLFCRQVTRLVSNIRRAAPDALLLFTTPSHNIYKKQSLNPNAARAAKTICALASELQFSVWDFNALMGAPENFYEWQQLGLALNDGIHFSAKGYQFQAELLFSALEEFEKQLQTEPKQ
ncbi:MAG: GDSL-type esterase/lipase family protein [Salinivirgaceae bacterium]|nr:GDSL-type esterase/lipase family protein [Salinivirgaceae bacterium]